MTEHQELPFTKDAPAIELEEMVEALIFVSKDPLTVERIMEILVASNIACDQRSVKASVRSLLAKWQDQARTIGRGLALEAIGGGYLFTTAKRQAEVVRTMAQKKPVMLSKSHLEVLSIVAYRQPITRVDVDEIRGVDSSFAIKRLMQLKLLKILGKSEGLGRPLLYGTTKQFLEFFSLNSLNDLPTLKQFQSLGHGEDADEIDRESDNVSIKDLFQSQATGMFSNEVQKLSDDALKSLDEALSRVDNVSNLDEKI